MKTKKSKCLNCSHPFLLKIPLLNKHYILICNECGLQHKVENYRGQFKIQLKDELNKKQIKSITLSECTL